MILKKAPAYFELEAVIIFCFNLKGELLLLRKTLSNRLYPGLWGSVAGKIEPGENRVIAAKREMQEETDNDVEMGEIIYLGKSFPTVHCVHVTGQPITFLAHMMLCTRALTNISISEEHAKYYWVSVSDILAQKFNLIPDAFDNLIDCLPILKKHVIIK